MKIFRKPARLSASSTKLWLRVSGLAVMIGLGGCVSYPVASPYGCPGCGYAGAFYPGYGYPGPYAGALIIGGGGTRFYHRGGWFRDGLHGPRPLPGWHGGGRFGSPHGFARGGLHGR